MPAPTTTTRGMAYSEQDLIVGDDARLDRRGGVRRRRCLLGFLGPRRLRRGAASSRGRWLGRLRGAGAGARRGGRCRLLGGLLLRGRRGHLLLNHWLRRRRGGHGGSHDDRRWGDFDAYERAGRRDLDRLEA